MASSGATHDTLHTAAAAGCTTNMQPSTCVVQALKLAFCCAGLAGCCCRSCCVGSLSPWPVLAQPALLLLRAALTCSSVAAHWTVAASQGAWRWPQPLCTLSVPSAAPMQRMRRQQALSCTARSGMGSPIGLRDMQIGWPSAAQTRIMGTQRQSDRWGQRPVRRCMPSYSCRLGQGRHHSTREPWRLLLLQAWS